MDSIKHIRRHRHFKMGITTGLIGGTLLSIILPHLTHEVILINAITNLFWVWEDSLE